MSATERVLFVHAHPDDESITTGGTIATLVDRGAEVTVVTCTRGERGEIIPDDLQYAATSSETLAALREMELRRALEALGVDDHRFLGDARARWAGRAPRRYVDSGMSWGERGRAESSEEFDPTSLTAAEFGDVAADIAAVIVDVQPDAVVSYDERGGYGHPDHVRAAQAAQRAAEVYGIPYFAVEPSGQADGATMHVDISPVFERKRAALEAHRSQMTVESESFLFSNGVRHPIDRRESFRRVHPAAQQERSTPAQRATVGAVTALASFAIGVATGAILTVYHQSSGAVAGTSVALGFITAVAVVAALLAGLRLVFETRLVPVCAAIGVVAMVALLSMQSAGGTILVPANGLGIAWSVAPTLTAMVVLAWPKTLRRGNGRIARQNVVKGSPEQ